MGMVPVTGFLTGFAKAVPGTVLVTAITRKTGMVKDYRYCGTGSGVITGYGSVEGFGYGASSLNNYGMGCACGSGNLREKFCGEGKGAYFGNDYGYGNCDESGNG